MATNNRNESRIMEDVLDAALDELDDDIGGLEATKVDVQEAPQQADDLPVTEVTTATTSLNPSFLSSNQSQTADASTKSETKKKSKTPKSSSSSNPPAATGSNEIPDAPPEMMEEMMKLEQMMKQLFRLPHQPDGGVSIGGDDDDQDDNELASSEEESRRMLYEMQQFMAHLESETNNFPNFPAPPSSPPPSQSQNPKSTAAAAATSSSSSTQKQQQQQQQQQPSASSSSSPLASSPPSNKNISESDVSKTISSLLDGMAKASNHDVNNDEDDDHQIPDLDTDFLQGMMKELEGLVSGGAGGGGGGGGSGFDADHVIDGMMEQLVSKEIMYEPLRQVTAKFPKWLADHKDKLPEKEFQERNRQYQCFQKLVKVYETDPNNVKELMTLMQDVQEYGQPPPEIIHEIAPGLELDEHGVPKMNGLGDGGLPFPGSEECLIM